MKQYKRVTQKMIAEKVGVSINTVSHALKDMDDISEETKKAVRKCAAELGYVGNVLAGSLRSGQTHTIAVIVSDISNPHFAFMIKEVVNCLREYSYTTFILNTNEDDALELEAIRSAMSRSVDGIIICPSQHSSENILYLKTTGIPFVLIGRHFSNIETNYVVCDDEQSGYQATKHLLAYEHTKIKMINAPLYISSAEERLEGYKRAMKESGLTVEEDNIISITFNGNVKKEIEKSSLFDTPFTAVIAFSDMIAWELISVLKEHGLQVPQDVSVIAFDDLQSQYAFPFSVSSITSSKTRMSLLATELLMDTIQGKNGGVPKGIVLPTKISQRGSCFYPRESR